MPSLLAQLYEDQPAAREAAVAEPAERDQLLALVAAIGRGGDTCWEG